MQLPLLAFQSITLSWTPSLSPGVTGYNVYYGAASGLYTNLISVGNVTNATISGLAGGTTYYFAATRIAGVAESQFSNEMVYDTSTVAKLSMTAVATQGVTTSIAIMATGAVPQRWALESSPDLKNWATIASGTNGNVNVSLPVRSLPKQFFRLKNN